MPEFTDREKHILALALQMAEQEGGWMWSEPYGWNGGVIEEDEYAALKVKLGHQEDFYAG